MGNIKPDLFTISSTLGMDDQHREEGDLGNTTEKLSLGNTNQNSPLNQSEITINNNMGNVQTTAPDLGMMPDHLKVLRIDLSIDEPDIEFLFEKDGVGCISKGDIIAIKGKAKAGKSTLLICLITALIKGEYMGFKASNKGCKVVYIDTEQNEANTRRMVRKVNALCGYDDKTNKWGSFDAFNLRGNKSEERSVLLDEIVEYTMPDLLIIDGAKDLISNGDINDPKSCGEVVQQLMTLTKNYPVAIITILHENKDNSNLRGHIGTELLNKCSECWQVKKSGDVFEVEQTENRNESVNGFSFELNDNNLPVAIEHTPQISKTERVIMKQNETFRLCLPETVSSKYTDLKTNYSESHPISLKTAESHIALARKRGYLIVDADGLYKFNYLRL